MPRTASFILIVLAAGCSQRAQWRPAQTSPAPTSMDAPAVNPPPATAPPTRTAAARPAPTRKAHSMIPLATAVSVEAPTDATAVAHLKGIQFPVGSSDSVRLDDSFDAPRDGGARKHNAVDIMAPRGTPVLSASDGHVLRLTKSDKGGLSLYATDLESQYVYYYAHFDRYNPKLYSGRPLMRGDTIGFVGTTGNSPKDLPHLHFQVMKMPADGKYWTGQPINPYPLLKHTASSGK